MKKLVLALGVFSLMSVANAADPLHGKLWKTFDDETGKPKAEVRFTQEPNGTLSASIVKILTPGQENACTQCQGKYRDVSLVGLKIVNNLRPDGNNSYIGGTILDPKSGKSYKLSSTLKGDKLEMRGYVGVSLLGRTQNWQLIK